MSIVAVSESAHTVTVTGNHAALGAQGTRFTYLATVHWTVALPSLPSVAHAPPGVKTQVPFAGTLPKFAEASSSRCLYRGYRFDNPASGLWDDVAKGVAARQGGSNFTGQHYTLFRHFDPSLMRFTSLDPLASSQNLWNYCENNPHGSFDPDGLETLSVKELMDRTQFRTGPLGGSMQGREWSQAYSGGGGIGGALDSFSSAPAGALYGAANTLTFGYYAQMISREKFASYWGVNAGSAGFAIGEMAGVGGATALLMALSAGGVSSALGAASGCAYSGVLAMVGEGVAWGVAGVVGGNAATRAIEGRWMTADENVTAGLMGFSGGFTGRFFGGAGAEARNLFGAPGSSVCFVAGTQVAVAGESGLADEASAKSGTLASKNIEDIELGDRVWSRNDETGEEGFKQVVHLFRNETTELAHLTYTSASVGATHESPGSTPPACGETFTLTGSPGHKFWSETHHKWTPMAELEPGEQLKLADGSTATVSQCTVEYLTQPVAIYNFEVADWHTYHVGSSTGWVWVHNRRIDSETPWCARFDGHEIRVSTWATFSAHEERTGTGSTDS